MTRLLIALALSSLLTACGAAATNTHTVNVVNAPATITDATFHAGVRAFYQMDSDDEARITLRDHLVEHLLGKAGPILEAADYRAIVDFFGTITAFYSPDDFVEHRIAPGLRPLAEWIVTHGSPSGREGEVLSATLVLSSLSANASAEAAASYTQIATWGTEVRANLPGVPERVNGIVRVWETHARLTPARPVLERLSQLLIERRNELQRLFSPENARTFAAGMTLEEYRASNLSMTRAPFDVAATFLAVGDLASALRHVEQMGGAAATEAQLIRVIRDAASDGEEADEALLTLARGYMEEELGRADVSLALCRLGQRRNPTDPRYPQCLGRIAAIEESFEDATAYYGQAIRIAPQERTLYDEALQVLSSLIDRYLASEHADANEMRTIAAEAEQILDERTRRFPGTPPPVAPEALHLVIGMSNMSAGDVDEARRHFEASLAARETNEALMQLGTIALRTGDSAHAVEYYRRALDRSPPNGPARASALELLGDAFGAANNAAQARRMYEQALGEWAQVQPDENNNPIMIDLHKSMLLDLLSRHEESAIALRRALNSGMGQLGVYTVALYHLVMAPVPDLALAHEVYRIAQRQLSVPPEWKVYFALWVKAIAARVHAEADADVDSTLRQLMTGTGWHAALARFGAGESNYETLIGAASNRGQEAEAHFYEGTRLMGTNDLAGARQRFGEVLNTRMISFYEYDMAQRLLMTVSAPAQTVATVPPAAPAP